MSSYNEHRNTRTYLIDSFVVIVTKKLNNGGRGAKWAVFFL